VANLKKKIKNHQHSNWS